MFARLHLMESWATNLPNLQYLVNREPEYSSVCVRVCERSCVCVCVCVCAFGCARVCVGGQGGIAWLYWAHRAAHWYNGLLPSLSSTSTGTGTRLCASAHTLGRCAGGVGASMTASSSSSASSKRSPTLSSSSTVAMSEYVTASTCNPPQTFSLPSHGYPGGKSRC